ncbi:MAG: hypothetical protein JWP36_271 [Paucimonas sp.]|nr:hypothetical protein [Paucimonas sp.]
MPSLHLFCRVIDNFGDIGVCWRLARQLVAEHGLGVTLWVDALASFQRLCPALDTSLETQQVEGVLVRHWREPFPGCSPGEVADIVVEGFGCHLPDNYLQAMAARPAKPAWINLEYLSAESWVDDCHLLPSPHPRLPLRKHFFFPGFTARTGGLLFERALDQAVNRFQADPNAAPAFLAALGLARRPGQRLLTLFCYPHAPLPALLSLLQEEGEPTLCVVAEGVASEAVGAFLGRAPRAGMQATRGALTLAVLPFLEQQDYDRLLWSADLNLVRGEDSFVRAQWAKKPLLWQIYPQDEAAHLVKLDAFLARYAAPLASGPGAALSAAMRGWNGQGIASADWRALWTPGAVASLRQHAASWAVALQQHGDLAGNLLRFTKESC